MSKLHIKKGDLVYVNSGDSRKQTGKVLKVFVNEQKAIVEGLNMVYKHTKPNSANPQGGKVKMEAPIHVSNLSLVDPKSGEPTRVSHVVVDGKKKRVSKKSGEVIE